VSGYIRQLARALVVGGPGTRVLTVSAAVSLIDQLVVEVEAAGS